MDFFFRILRALTSTLFPYTTLFRSDRPVRHVELHGDRERPRVEPLLDHVADPRSAAGKRRFHGAALHGARRDRKSTRLNSSHGYISYAVFCLKKKKKPQFHRLPRPR